MYFHLLLLKLVYNLHSELVVFVCCFFRNISTVAVFCLNLYEIFEVLGLDQLQNSVFRVAIIFMCINQWLGIFSISIFSYRIVNGEVERVRDIKQPSRAAPTPLIKTEQITFSGTKRMKPIKLFISSFLLTTPDRNVCDLHGRATSA